VARLGPESAAAEWAEQDSLLGKPWVSAWEFLGISVLKEIGERVHDLVDWEEDRKIWVRNEESFLNEKLSLNRN
jgi:hypothetical protein